jgi:hypothetical protein
MFRSYLRFPPLQYGTIVPVTVPLIDLKRQLQPIREGILADGQTLTEVIDELE